jgi:hypothetical protein
MPINMILFFILAMVWCSGCSGMINSGGSSPKTSLNSQLLFSGPYSASQSGSVLAANPTGSGADTGAASTSYRFAQGFQPTSSGNLGTLTAYFNIGAGSVTGTVTASIYTDNSGQPGTALNTSAATSLSGLTTSYQAIVFTIPSTAVTNGIQYWWVINYSNMTFNGQTIFSEDSSSNPYAGGNWSYSTDGGSTWNNAGGTYDLVFSFSSLAITGSTPVNISLNTKTKGNL